MHSNYIYSWSLEEVTPLNANLLHSYFLVSTIKSEQDWAQNILIDCKKKRSLMANRNFLIIKYEQNTRIDSYIKLKILEQPVNNKSMSVCLAIPAKVWMPLQTNIFWPDKKTNITPIYFLNLEEASICYSETHKNSWKALLKHLE